MGAPTIVTIRPGVGFAPDAAASFRRAERDWGRQIGCNSTYRDYGLQLSMWQAWEAWTQGRGPKPNHSRPARPEDSKHVMGLALDTSDISIPGFLAHMADHGWIQILPDDPTERHHLEYQWWRDNHRNDPTPAGEEEDDMFDAKADARLQDVQNKLSMQGASYGRPEVIQQRTDEILGRMLVKDPKTGQVVWDYFQQMNNQIISLTEMVAKLAGGQSVDVRALFAEQEQRLVASFSQQIDVMRVKLEAEIISTLSQVEGITQEQIAQGVELAFSRAFQPVEAS